jgi:hypothetical protein
LNHPGFNFSYLFVALTKLIVSSITSLEANRQIVAAAWSCYSIWHTLPASCAESRRAPFLSPCWWTFSRALGLYIAISRFVTVS